MHLLLLWAAATAVPVARDADAPAAPVAFKVVPSLVTLVPVVDAKVESSAPAKVDKVDKLGASVDKVKAFEVVARAAAVASVAFGVAFELPLQLKFLLLMPFQFMLIGLLLQFLLLK